ncbi:hypothetical protein KAURM247S_01928 [Kitasatospora aureofaciens]
MPARARAQAARVSEPWASTTSAARAAERSARRVVGRRRPGPRTAAARSRAVSGHPSPQVPGTAVPAVHTSDTTAPGRAGGTAGWGARAHSAEAWPRRRSSRWRSRAKFWAPPRRSSLIRCRTRGRAPAESAAVGSGMDRPWHSARPGTAPSRNLAVARTPAPVHPVCAEDPPSCAGCDRCAPLLAPAAPRCRPPLPRTPRQVPAHTIEWGASRTAPMDRYAEGPVATRVHRARAGRGNGPHCRVVTRIG